MATLYWEGKAAAVAQISTVQVTGFDASTTYTITIGGVAISAIGNTSVNQTAADLAAALEAATHPYFAAITWTAATDTVTATADVAGVPFIAASSVTGGAGTIGAVTAGTANASPNDWANPANWSSGAMPANGDTVIARDSDISISWGLDQNALDLVAFHPELSYTGSIGLRFTGFATSSDGQTVDLDATEYRDHYLLLGADRIEVGQHTGPGTPAGSQRIKINNNEAGASDLVVHATASSGEDSQPALMYLAAHASADVDIRQASGGVGIAVDEPGETSTVGAVTVSQTGNNARAFIGAGVVFTSFEQRGGLNRVDVSGATTPDLIVHGGELLISGVAPIDALEIYGGTVTDNHDVTSGDHITTLTLDGETAELDWTKAAHARTVATTNHFRGRIDADWDNVTQTTNNLGERLRSVTVGDI